MRAAKIGVSAAFGELYRRHAPGAQDFARRLTYNADDAADAVADAFTKLLAYLSRPDSTLRDFRSYLLTAIRHAVVDIVRSRCHDVPTDDADAFADPSPLEEPAQATIGSESRTMMAEAFHHLPRRWQEVLWLAEVEGRPPRETACQLGLSPNNVSQLAVRARARLRARYVQAHVGPCAVRACRPTVARLGAHVTRSLPRREAIQVTRHLAACARCRERFAELAIVDPRSHRGSSSEARCRPCGGKPPSRPLFSRPARRGSPLSPRAPSRAAPR